MASHGKLRKDRGSLTDYESQVKEIRWQLAEQLRSLDGQGELRRELLQDLGEFMRRRAEVELEYSKGLEKLSERFLARGGRTSGKDRDQQNFRKEPSLLSPLHCWYVLLQQTRQESRDHGALSEVLAGPLAQQLSHIGEDVGRLVKKSKDLEQQLQEDLLKVVSELQMAMKTYQTYRAESVSSEGKLREAERQEEKRAGRCGEFGTSQGIDGHGWAPPRRTSLKKGGRLVEKRQAKFLEHKLKCTKARNEYLLSLASANAAVSNYYLRDAVAIMDCSDLGFHLALSKVLRGYTAAVTRAKTSPGQGPSKLDIAVDTLDPEGDKSKVLEFHASAYCPPFRFEYQPYEGDEVSEVQVPVDLEDEILPRAKNIQARLDQQNIETGEVNKTLKASLQSLLDQAASDDSDVLDAFQASPSTESLKSTGSDPGCRQLARRRGQQQETETFYILKLQEYLSCRSILTKLQAKHEKLQEAIQRGNKEDCDGSRARCAMTRSQRNRRPRPSSQYNHKLFSGDMEKFIQSSGQAVPLVVESCIRFINLHGLQHEGIFRVPGAQLRVTEIRNAFERGEDPLVEGYSAHDLDSVAGVLKLYFRGLETPLFPSEMFGEMLAAVELESPRERAELVKGILGRLPGPVLVVLRYLFTFLNHLAQYSDENMMDPYNLAVCFGPTLVVVPPEQDPVAVQGRVNQLVQTLILQPDLIFPTSAVLPGPLYEKCMTPPHDDFGDTQLDATAEESEQDVPVETSANKEETPVLPLESSGSPPESSAPVPESEGSVEAVACFDYVGRTPQELTFQRGDLLWLHTRASGEWWRGERAGTLGLIPHKYIKVPEKPENRVTLQEGQGEGELVSKSEDLTVEPMSRMRTNSEGGYGRARPQASSGNPVGKLTSPFLDPTHHPLTLTSAGRAVIPGDRPERRNTMEMPGPSGCNWRCPAIITSDKKLEVDKNVAQRMESVFKELLGKANARQVQKTSDTLLSSPEASSSTQHSRRPIGPSRTGKNKVFFRGTGAQDLP
ncbi:rho GTPase-activating protein 4 isoform X1 [Vombatus ursinus]|uniref:Rho GTPase activating protein 4 n=1 Tax=Vombatus ursinus TaxID=29139 RepID=A0A4X2LR26_VOMUR|nr:rho GTPase-activating protein 4 isoform X1 [Vombatus ursinus]